MVLEEVNQATFSTIFIFSLKHLGSGPSHYTQALAQLTASLLSSSVSFCKIHLNVHSCGNGVGFRIQNVSIRFGTSKSVFSAISEHQINRTPKEEGQSEQKDENGYYCLVDLIFNKLYRFVRRNQFVSFRSYLIILKAKN